MIRNTLTCIALLMTALISPSQAADGGFKLPLWKGLPPGGKVSDTYKEIVIYRDNDPGKPRSSQVTNPEIQVFLPATEKASGAAVVICPGGGYGMLAYDHEGIDVARWFNERGVAGIVLKYRLPSDQIMEDKSIGPLQDVQQAIRLVRRNAAAWKIDPAKIGVMGFSAGGHLAGSASTRYDESVYTPEDAVSARPDFSILVYGVLSMQAEITHGGSRKNLLGDNPSQEAVNRASNELRINAHTPPAFLIHAQDDKAVPVANSLRYYEAMIAHGISGELHIHEKGGHGFGLGVNPGSPAHWTKDLESWMKAHGWI
jgi:acetyl esterase/lipase